MEPTEKTTNPRALCFFSAELAQHRAACALVPAARALIPRQLPTRPFDVDGGRNLLFVWGKIKYPKYDSPFMGPETGAASAGRARQRLECALFCGTSGRSVPGMLRK